MREETVLFFDAIVREDRSVLEVIDADYTFVNERLAAHYKIDGVKGPRCGASSWTDPARGGVLGHAGILTVTSFPHRTSPVLRGRWVLEELLGAEVPPPPPDVPVLNERQKGRQEPDPPAAAGEAPRQGGVCVLPHPHGPARLRPGELRRRWAGGGRSRAASRSTARACCRPARSSAGRRS